MKKISSRWGFLLLLFAFACKSTQKLFDEGQYEKAIYSSLDDLKKDPSNTSTLQLLTNAYNEASKQLLHAIEEANTTPKADRPDRIYNSYNSLQKLYNSIAALTSARKTVNPVDYSNELKNAANEASEFRYNRGVEFLNRGDKASARKAYADLKMADTYVPGYKDVVKLKDEAYDLAVTNVAINNIRQMFGSYSFSSSLLESDILWELKSIGRDNFYSFYTIWDAQNKRIRVDQVMDMSLYDMWLSGMSTSNYSYNVSKDISEPAPDPKDPAIKRTVTATVNVTRRLMDARASMDCRITDPENRQIIYSQRFPARYTWENLTGNYSGDSRALSQRDLSIINGSYSTPPSEDELFRELMKRIKNDFVFEMRRLYNNN